MANKAKKANIANHIRQREFSEKGILMLPKKPIREKSRHKQLVMANRMLKAGIVKTKKAKRLGRTPA